MFTSVRFTLVRFRWGFNPEVTLRDRLNPQQINYEPVLVGNEPCTDNFIVVSLIQICCSETRNGLIFVKILQFSGSAFISHRNAKKKYDEREWNDWIKGLKAIKNE